MIQNNSNLFDVKDIILDFKLNIISSKLSKTTHYNSYQQKLYLYKKKKKMKKVIYSILTLGFLVSCSSGGSDSPEPLSEQLIIGTWELSEMNSDLQVFTIMNDSSRNILLDTSITYNREELIDIYDGTLAVMRFDENGTVINMDGDIANWSLNDDQYRIYDSETEYTGDFSIDSERLILYDLMGEQLSYDTINQNWRSYYSDFTFSKILKED